MSWTIRHLRAGSFRLDGGAMFGLIPRTFWAKWTPPDESNRIELACNSLLLEGPAGRVLVESGYGDKFAQKERGIYALEERTVTDALAEAGVASESITLVVLTHLHFDHAGGCTRRADGRSGAATAHECVPTFPNARIAVQRREWEDALANRSTMTRTYLRENLEPLASSVRLLDGEAELLPGLRVGPLPGHTPGQQGVWIETASGTVVFPGDLLPTLHHAHRAASMGYDMCAFETMETKQRFLAQASEQRWAIALDHDPVHTLVHASQGTTRIELVPG